MSTKWPKERQWRVGPSRNCVSIRTFCICLSDCLLCPSKVHFSGLRGAKTRILVCRLIGDHSSEWPRLNVDQTTKRASATSLAKERGIRTIQLMNLNMNLSYRMFSWFTLKICKSNVWVAKKDTKRSSNTLLCLVSFFATQTLAGI
jgi:hypothetical protein